MGNNFHLILRPGGVSGLRAESGGHICALCPFEIAKMPGILYKSLRAEDMVHFPTVLERYHIRNTVELFDI